MKRDIDEELVWALHGENRSLERVREVVAEGANVNARNDDSLSCSCEACLADDYQCNASRDTVLMHAVFDRRVQKEIVRYLIEQGADVRAVNDDDKSVLTMGIWNINFE